MRVFIRFVVFALLLVTAGSFKNIEQRISVIVKGKVIADVSGQPLQKAHVYIIDGEEEALTNKEGEFQIESWQKVPFRITVNGYNNYQKTVVLVNDVKQLQVIRLKIK